MCRPVPMGHRAFLRVRSVSGSINTFPQNYRPVRGTTGVKFRTETGNPMSLPRTSSRPMSLA
eukprot:6510867-Prymnesium_polylepis.1